jgi:hypothetical protein
MDGHQIGSHSRVRREILNKGYTSHHIVQHAAVRHLDGYSRGSAPAIALEGLPAQPGTQHGRATAYQRTATNRGTLAAEYRVGFEALVAATGDPALARKAVKDAMDYFESLGHGPDTLTRDPNTDLIGPDGGDFEGSGSDWNDGHEDLSDTSEDSWSN